MHCSRINYDEKQSGGGATGRLTPETKEADTKINVWCLSEPLASVSVCSNLENCGTLQLVTVVTEAMLFLWMIYEKIFLSSSLHSYLLLFLQNTSSGTISRQMADAFLGLQPAAADKYSRGRDSIVKPVSHSLHWLFPFKKKRKKKLEYLLSFSCMFHPQNRLGQRVTTILSSSDVNDGRSSRTRCNCSLWDYITNTEKPHDTEL